MTVTLVAAAAGGGRCGGTIDRWWQKSARSRAERGGGMRSKMVFGFALQREAIRTTLEAHAVPQQSGLGPLNPFHLFQVFLNIQTLSKL
jgi:hypothetical protein